MHAEPAGTLLEACPFCGADHDEAALRCPTNDMILPFAGRLLAGKFRLVSELGRGGMGAVWRARNVHVDREVALKLILPEVSKNPEIVARFQNEARVAARIGHPGICDILDLESSALGPVIVMELLRGENLGQRITRDRRLPVPLAVSIIREALSALEAAHRAGIIHRDLKPENLFLHQPEVGPTVVKLMDFGISKFIDRDGALTANGVIMGTPEYMAPEQVNGAVHADARTDIWAIGALLYKALSGEEPFAGPTVPATLVAIITADPAPLQSHVSAVPDALSAVILRCLAKKPEARFQTAAELSEALRPFEAPEIFESRPPTADTSLGALPTVEVEVSAVAAILPVTTKTRRKTPWLLASFVLWLGIFGAWSLAAENVIQSPTAEPDTSSNIVIPDNNSDDTGAIQTGTTSGAATPEPEPEPEPEPSSPTTGAAVVEEPAQKPAELVVMGDLVTPVVAGKVGDQRWAKQYCAALAQNKFLNISKWKLANPGEARQFAKGTGFKAGGYWTSAAHKGRGLVVWLPRGTDSSVRVTTKAGRPLCVAPKPPGL